MENLELKNTVLEIEKKKLIVQVLQNRGDRGKEPVN